MFRENNGLRIVALVLAAMIWLQSVLVSEQRSVVSLPINLLYVPQNITLEDIPESIPFSVKGKGQDILKMMLFKPKVNIDASKITQYSDILTLEDYSIDLPDNVNVTFLGPAQSDRIAIQADVFHQKVVPVVLDFSDDNSRERIRELNYTLDPDKLTIFGPKTRIKNIKSVRTKPISASDLAESQSKLELKLPEGDVSVSESSVLLTISGVQEETRVFPNIVLPGKYLPSMVAVKVRGEAAVLDRLNKLILRPA
ncbi:MAG TPA: YbbR-like domain-containing protein [Candidatus Cloacimonadota bacterium]|nr:YbbR-like domain-containing protein [Candidatus Cloacimonadota bacterium]